MGSLIPSRKNCHGQALTEYPLVMGLILVVCIGLLVTIGGNIGNLFNMINTGGGKGLGSVAQATLGVNGGASSGNGSSIGGSGISGSEMPNEGSTSSTILPNGSLQIAVNDQTYVLPSLVDPAAVVTSASNGSDISLAYYQNLTSLAEKLEEIVPEEDNLADKIRDVAHEGYEMADDQAIVEEFAPNNRMTWYGDGMPSSAIPPQEAITRIDVSIAEISQTFSELQTAIAESNLEDGAKEALNDSIEYNVEAIKLIGSDYKKVTEVDSGGSVDHRVETFNPRVRGSDLTDKHSETICKHQSTHPSCRDK